MENLKTTQEIINHFASFAKKLNCTDSVCVTITHWSHSKPYVKVLLQSEAINPRNHQPQYLLGAEVPYNTKLNYKVLELRLEAEWLMQEL
jgi:hypothetical protein